VIRILLLFLLLVSGTGFTAQTVGLWSNTADAFDGYTLVAPTGATRTHLIDNCGRIVNQWDSEFRAGESAYLLDDGSLLRTARQSSTVFTGGGMGGRIERFTWDGDLIWSYTLANDTAHHHHDMAWMPNGHLLIMAWEYRSPEEAAAAGRLDAGPLWPPMIIEVVPEGDSGGEVVWEWHAWDHLIQNANPDLPNYGSPSDHPGRFNVNYADVSGGGGIGGPGSGTGGDWFHCNALAYHPGLDQIILNSRNWNEFYILDHGTTSQEAAGEAGDLLYRWGNPTAYGRGLDADRALFSQHDPHWLFEEGPTSNGSDPSATVLLYNNGNNRPDGPMSTVEELILPLQPEGSYLLADDAPFGPDAPDWTYPETLDPDFFSPNISGAQRLPNGNTLICEGNSGHLFEVTSAGETVWEYVTAYNQFGAIVQGNNPFGNSTFRAYRYAPNHPAFDGRDMTPGDPVESNPLPFDCQLYPAAVDTTTQAVSEADLVLRIGPNPVADLLHVTAARPLTWTLLDVTGRPVLPPAEVRKRHTIEVAPLPAGVYHLSLSDATGRAWGTRRILIQH
jgi:hypothetical protein